MPQGQYSLNDVQTSPPSSSGQGQYSLNDIEGLSAEARQMSPSAARQFAQAADSGVGASLKRTAGSIIHLPSAVIDAFSKEPQTEDEKFTLANSGYGGLGLSRLIAHPMAQEHIKAQQLRAQAQVEKGEGQSGQQAATNFWTGTEHAANMHDIASVVPVVGPMAADIVQRYVSGDKSGAVTDLGTAVAGPKVAEGVLGGAAKVGTKVLNNVAPDLAERLYQSGLKPSTTIPLAKRAQIIRTGLDAGIPISPAGAEKLSGLISDLNHTISGKIKAGAQAGQMVDPEAIAARLDQVKTRFANQVNPEGDLAAIEASKQEFLKRYGAVDDSGQYAYRSRDVGEQGVPSQSRSQAGLDPQQIKGYMPSRAQVTGKPQELVKVDLTKLNPSDYTLIKDPQGGPSWVKFNKDLPESAVDPTQIPVDKAQSLKQGTYQQLKGRAYGEMKGATVEAQKSLARGIKEELETQFPEIKGLNAQEAKFYNLDSMLERALNRIGNHQLMGIGTPIAAGAGAAVGGGPGAIAAATMKAVLDNPVVKSRLAIALNKAGRGKISLGMANARVNQFVNALAQSQGGAGASQSSSTPPQ